jgi:hypothetical protein
MFFGNAFSHARARGVGRSPHGRGGSRKYPAAETAETVTFPVVSPQLPPHPYETERLSEAARQDGRIVAIWSSLPQGRRFNVSVTYSVTYR